MPDVSVVIPVFNEVESVPHLGDALNRALVDLGRSYEVVLVDDGSSDGTWEALCTVAGKYEHFRLVRLRRNFGQTAALSAGFHQCKGDVVITMDADLQNDPADIPLLLKKIDQGADVVSGWRKKRRDPFLNRRLPSKIANAIISKITGVPLHDYGCTLKAYRREMIQDLHLYGEMHRFIPALASWTGGRIEEVVVNHKAREYGTSKYGISRTVRVILDLMTVKFLLRYSARPIQIFGRIGMLFALPGLLLLGLMVAANVGYWCGISALGDVVALLKRSPFWVVASFMLILFGIHFISIGLLAELQTRTYHEAQKKPIYVIRETVE
jgi:glycosyltransferase involved in cell wall biosynthesis